MHQMHQMHQMQLNGRQVHCGCAAKRAWLHCHKAACMIAQEPSPQEPSALPKLPAAAKLPAAGTAAAATGDGCSGPRRAILTNDDLARFQRTDTSQRFVAFLESLNAAVRNKTLRQDVAVSPTVAAVLAMLDTLDAWAADIEPDEASKSRFGNVSFQLWHDRLVARSDELVASFVPDGTTFQPAPAVDVVPAEPSAPADASANASADSPADAPLRPDLPPLDTAAVRLEVATYLQHSFGNRKRIDYGTGHEAHFIAFLLCLDRLGLVSVQDYPALVLRVFWRYIGVMRTLQFRYWLEPAGSHGVWGLDDYHFLPFYFGASQLADHKHLRPKCIHDPDIVATSPRTTCTWRALRSSTPSKRRRRCAGTRPCWTTSAASRSGPRSTRACSRCTRPRCSASCPSCSTFCLEPFCRSRAVPLTPTSRRSTTATTTCTRLDSLLQTAAACAFPALLLPRKEPTSSSRLCAAPCPLTNPIAIHL
ncbi:hypothetical protein BC831DRAFT_441204, partial [Entophlyctis helioformis]